MNPFVFLGFFLARSQRVCRVCGVQVTNASKLENGRCERCRNASTSKNNDRNSIRILKGLVISLVIIIVAMALFAALS